MPCRYKRRKNKAAKQTMGLITTGVVSGVGANIGTKLGGSVGSDLSGAMSGMSAHYGTYGTVIGAGMILKPLKKMKL